MGVTMKNPQVQRQHQQHKNDESYPKPNHPLPPLCVSRHLAFASQLICVAQNQINVTLQNGY